MRNKFLYVASQFASELSAFPLILYHRPCMVHIRLACILEKLLLVVLIKFNELGIYRLVSTYYAIIILA